MKTLYIIIAVIITASACKKSQTNHCIPARKDYTFQSGKQIDTIRRAVADTNYEFYAFSLKDGDKSVFNFTWSYQDCPEVADDEGARIITFEIPQNVNSFLLKDSADLRKAKALLNNACFCYPSSPILIKGGTIEGEKKANNRWHIKAALIILPKAMHTIDFEADFVAQ